MPAERDDLVEIAVDGSAVPAGPVATRRLQARAGHAFRVLPSPSEFVLLKRVAEADETVRPCILAGEVVSAGALCDILSFVGHTASRGEFVVHDNSTTRSLFFEQGHVVGAQSTATAERLGEVLYRYGVLTREQVAQCAEASADGSLRIGEAAVRFGYVAREALFAHMARQTEAIFYGMLQVSTGSFYYLDGFDDGQLSARHKLSLTNLVREGIRRMHETRFFRSRIPSELHVPVRAPDRAPPQGDALRLYQVIDGSRSIADICRAIGAGEFEVTRTVFQLVQSGHVTIRAPRLPPRTAVDVYNEAISLILRELDAMDEGDAVRAQLAEFAAKSASFRTYCANAGPVDDGTLDADRVAANVAASRKPDAEDELAAWLYDYASYALFLARPQLRRMEQARTGQARISKRVTAMLEPIAPPKAPRSPE